MICNRCGKSLPSDGIVCKFCGAAMSQEQINYKEKMKDKTNKKLELLSEKYGQNNNVNYREEKENKGLGLAVIIIILLFLIVLAILVNVTK